MLSWLRKGGKWFRMVSTPRILENFSMLVMTSCLRVIYLSLKLLISAGRRAEEYFLMSGPAASANHPMNYTNLITKPLFGSDSLFFKVSMRSRSPLREMELWFSEIRDCSFSRPVVLIFQSLSLSYRIITWMSLDMSVLFVTTFAYSSSSMISSMVSHCKVFFWISERTEVFSISVIRIF